MSDFTEMWNSVGALAKTALSVAALGGVGFLACWIIATRDALTGGMNLNKLLELIEQNAPDKFQSFYSGDTIFRNRWKLNQSFYQFLKSEELDEMPEIKIAKQKYALSYSQHRKMLPVISVFFILMLSGIGVMGYLIATGEIQNNSNHARTSSL